MARFREAALTLDEGLRLDPLNGSMQQLHAEASRGVLGELLEGDSQGSLWQSSPAVQHPFAWALFSQAALHGGLTCNKRLEKAACL